MADLSMKEVFFEKPLFIQSLESKTNRGAPVFNEITWFEFEDKDVWMMNQSHFGPNPAPEKKDRVVIVIDKTKSPKSAYFMQVKPGPLQWSQDLYSQKISYKVSCFICHVNGLRTIRPDHAGQSLNFVEMAKLNYMNYKMNSYGLVVEDKSHEKEDLALSVPFRYREKFENDILKIESCTACHDGKARGQLTRQNASSIDFLMRNKMMPPLGYKISKAEVRKIQNFILGF